MNEENKQEDIYYSQFMQEIKRVSKETGIKIPELYYRYGLCRCYKCDKEILVFAWPHKIPKEKPIPETIGRKATTMSGRKY